MSGISRQTIDAGSAIGVLSLLWFIVLVGVVYWFYSSIKRIERTLQEIKKSLEGRASTAP